MPLMPGLGSGVFHLPFRMKAIIAIITVALLGISLAAYKPVAPQRGSYTWNLVLEKGNQDTYVAGRLIYDFVAGYVRMESWNTPEPNPGINGISIWDLRETQPIVQTIDQNAQCFVQKLNDNLFAPMPDDYSSYSFQQFKYFNRALAEMWTEPGGGYLYVDIFTRDIVGMGNSTASEDGTVSFYNIFDWSDKTPDGTSFLLPNTLGCKAINASDAEAIVPDHAVKPHGIGSFIKCNACQIGIGLVLGRLCGVGGAAVCAPFPPAVPFCALLAQGACSLGAKKLDKTSACRIIKMC